MPGQLGIGVRVYIGWTDSDQVESDYDARCETGRITAGPFPPGYYESRESLIFISHPAWNVLRDASGTKVMCTEDVLFPIDDGDPAAEQTRKEKLTEV